MYKVDSFKISIPLSECKYISPILDKCILLSSDGEILSDEFKQSAYKCESLGYCSTYYSLSERFDFVLRKNVKFLTILINSKLLGKYYFYGITKETLKILYKNIIAQKMATFPFNALIYSDICDVDICKDFQMPHKIYDNYCTKTIEHIKQNCNANGYKHFTKNKNKGFQISVRDTQSAIKSPFVKVYYKGSEIQNKQNQGVFNEIENDYKEHDAWHYFHKTLETLRRCEITVKNIKHFKYITKEDNKLTLDNLLNNDLKVIFNKIIAVYFDTQKSICLRSEIKGKDLMISGLIQLHINEGKNVYDLMDFVLSLYPEKVQKSRAKKQFLELSKNSLNIDEYRPVFETFFNSLEKEPFPTMM